MNKTQVIRDLAKQVRDYADMPINDERRLMWKELNELKPNDYVPILLCGELRLFRQILPKDCMGVIEPVYRHVEYELRKKLWYASLETDMVIEPWLDLNAIYFDDSITMWGVEMQFSEIGDSTVFHGEIEKIEDIDKLHVPFLRVDGTRTLEFHDRMTEVLDGILDVRVEWRHRHLVQPNLAIWTTQFMGQQRFLEWCVDYPEAIKKFMRIFAKTFAQHNLDMERRGRLTDNHCFIPEWLPWHDKVVDKPKLKDLWIHSEAQEFHIISPQMFDEYLLTYMKPLLAMFGKVSYGCCECQDGKLGLIKTIPNLRRITISECTNWDYAIETLEDKVVYSVRPSMVNNICIGDEGLTRKEIKAMMKKFKGLCWDINLPGVANIKSELQIHKWVKLVRGLLN